MAKKKQVPVVLTREQKIEEAKRRFHDFSRPSHTLMPKPNREFKVGDEAQIGNLENCRIIEIIDDGKALVIEHTVLPTRDNPNPSQSTIGVWWWFESDERKANRHSKQFTRPAYRGQESTSSIDALFHMFACDGFVCNTKYQRGYVWTQADKERLIESIFNRMGIGYFVFVRNHGYLHKGDKTLIKHYVNLQGESVEVPRENNYTIEIIDGQQRITTLLAFITDQFAYKGVKFSELAYPDQHQIHCSLMNYRIIEEEDVNEKELLEMFLNVNAGVPQDQSHLEAVRTRLKGMK